MMIQRGKNYQFQKEFQGLKADLLNLSGFWRQATQESTKGLEQSSEKENVIPICKQCKQQNDRSIDVTLDKPSFYLEVDFLREKVDTLCRDNKTLHIDLQDCMHVIDFLVSKVKELQKQASMTAAFEAKYLNLQRINEEMNQRIAELTKESRRWQYRYQKLFDSVKEYLHQDDEELNHMATIESSLLSQNEALRSILGIANANNDDLERAYFNLTDAEDYFESPRNESQPLDHIKLYNDDDPDHDYRRNHDNDSDFINSNQDIYKKIQENLRELQMLEEVSEESEDLEEDLLSARIGNS
eukprot:TRINITY_DN11722_c0_g1_i1.p1 TRINITY_DN11722_c0_g1~~TRINITY_DN11722_c0_g1_i1.p1  ORF type:complete len:299 (+),score=37.41 TRINITY_DN11722_c0_g1_i1:68-964(+)